MIRTSILGLAAIALLSACSDAGPTNPAPPVPAAPPAAQLLRGTIVPNPSHVTYPAVLLLTDDGATYQLSGANTVALKSVMHAVVEVQGSHLGPAQIDVLSFTVLEVQGRPVRDGILAQQGPDYVLQLASGEQLGLANVPSGLALALGNRVWVAISGDGQVTSYGIIAQAPRNVAAS